MQTSCAGQETNEGKLVRRSRYKKYLLARNEDDEFRAMKGGDAKLMLAKFKIRIYQKSCTIYIPPYRVQSCLF